ESYEKQGLLGNAMAEYRNLVDYYGRNGMIADEIKTLEKMRDLDLNNLNVRVKIAEVYANNDRKEEGYTELESVLEILYEKSAFDKIFKLYKMFLPLYPNHIKLQMGLSLAFYEKGDFGRGVTILEKLLHDKPDDSELLRLLGRGYTNLKGWTKACETYQRLLVLDPTDLNIRELMIKCAIDSGQYECALTELEEWKESFFKADRLDCLIVSYEALKEKLVDNRVVLQALDSIYELSGEGNKLLDIISEQENDRDELIDNETLSNSLLESATEDVENSEIDFGLTAESSDLTYDIIEDETVDLQLESSLEKEFAGESADALIELDIDDGLDLDQDKRSDLEFSFDLEEKSPEKPMVVIERNVQADLEEAEFYIQQGLYTDAEKLCHDILANDPESAECRQKLEEISLLLNREQKQPAADQAVLTDSSLTGNTDIEFDFDSLQSSATTEKKIFKTDVDEQIADDDMESHYNLGIAYREMGLLNDAISEFEKAEKEPSRYVDCQTLKGLSFSDKGDFENAEIMFQQALDSTQLEDLQRLNLCYELGLLYERLERSNDALISYQNVFSQDNNYRDVMEKIIVLKNALGITDDNSAVVPEEKRERISFL
ncbi:MAG: tetratricopeptide repeat protein, partial [Thermodesulfobacteriota bacterium]|nr:tetratricopeptide repeat protein [Thermodesulfobacteriota bacterium]